MPVSWPVHGVGEQAAHLHTERGSTEMVMPPGMAPERSRGAQERVPIGQ